MSVPAASADSSAENFGIDSEPPIKGTAASPGTQLPDVSALAAARYAESRTLEFAGEGASGSQSSLS